MGLLYYLPADAEVTPIEPDPDADWDDTTIFERLLAKTAKRSLAMTTVSFSTTGSSLRAVLFRQLIGDAETAGDIIVGSQTVHMQCLCSSVEGAAWDWFLCFGLRVLNSDGTIVRKTIVPVTAGGNPTDGAATLVNRTVSVISASGNYTIQSGDRKVLEIGMKQQFVV